MEFDTWLISYKNKSLKTAKLYFYWANKGANLTEVEFIKQKNTQSKRLMYFALKYYSEYKGREFWNISPPKIRAADEKKFLELNDYRKIANNYIDENASYSYIGKVLAELTFIYGLRISEALNLKADDINNEHMIIRGKGDKIRVIPISEKFSSFFENVIGFVCSTNGKKTSYSTSRTILSNIKMNLKLDDDITWHSFRHGFAVRLLMNKIDLYTISNLLGHKSIETTTTYLRFNFKDTRNEFKKLGLYA